MPEESWVPVLVPSLLMGQAVSQTQKDENTPSRAPEEEQERKEDGKKKEQGREKQKRGRN